MGSFELSSSEELLSADVVIIGAGGAGQRAALAAREKGMDVLVVTKGLVGRSGNTPMGRFSFCVTQTSAGNSFEAHAKDIFSSGDGLSDPSLVDVFITEAPNRVQELLAWRMRFDRKDGKLEQVRVPGHTEARALHFRQETGLEITRTMRRQVSRTGVRILEDTPIVSIVVEDGAVTGILGINIWNGRSIRVNAPSVVIAAGGAGSLYEVTSNSKDATGDSYALGYEAGAELIDMEMTQFLPFGLIQPSSLHGCTDPGGAMITAGAWLLNSRNERFMEKYDPKRMEFSTRAIIARAIAEEVSSGRGTDRGGVWLQLPADRGKPSEVIESMWCDYMRQGGVDVDSGPLEIAPSCHYMMGGLGANQHAETTVEGLFAAGEAMGGLHGANRLAGHGLVEGQVFGALAGDAAARLASRKKGQCMSDTVRRRKWEEFRHLVCGGSTSTKSWEIKRAVASTMNTGGSYVRSQSGLEAALRRIQYLEVELSGMKTPPTGLALLEAIEARHLIITAQAVLRSALYRKESRGAHVRSDYAKIDDANFKWHVSVSRAIDNSMLIGSRALQ